MASRGPRLSADDWVRAALAAFAEGGLAVVAVEPLAARLGTTKGSFYWHFPNRDALVTAALERWESERTDEIIALVGAADAPRQRLRQLLTRVISSTGRDALETQILAVGDHPLVADVARRVVERRIRYTIGLFSQCGFTPAEATARGLLLYTAYTGHDQLSARLPGSLSLDAVGGVDAYTEAVLALVLAGAPADP